MIEPLWSTLVVNQAFQDHLDGILPGGAKRARTTDPLLAKNRGPGRLTWPVAGEPLCGVSVSDRDLQLITVRSGTPRARA